MLFPFARDTHSVEFAIFACFVGIKRHKCARGTQKAELHPSSQQAERTIKTTNIIGWCYFAVLHFLNVRHSRLLLQIALAADSNGFSAQKFCAFHSAAVFRKINQRHYCTRHKTISNRLDERARAHQFTSTIFVINGFRPSCALSQTIASITLEFVLQRCKFLFRLLSVCSYRLRSIDYYYFHYDHHYWFLFGVDAALTATGKPQQRRINISHRKNDKSSGAKYTVEMKSINSTKKHWYYMNGNAC